MGPSSFNDGNKQHAALFNLVWNASMGPSSFNDGNMDDVVIWITQGESFNGAVVFQRRKQEAKGVYCAAGH